MSNSISRFIVTLLVPLSLKYVVKLARYRICLSFVGDVFAIFDTTESLVDDILARLNNRYWTIKFTVELEKEKCLQF